MKKVWLPGMLMLFGTSVFAAGWTPPMTISSAFTEDSDLLVLYTSDPTVFTTGCSGGTWIFTGPTDARRARVWATALAAVTAGARISLWYTDSCAAWNYHNFMSIKIIP